MKSVQSILSDLARIELKSNDPIDLYTEWSSEAKKFSLKKMEIVCLSTVSTNGTPRARHVLLQRHDSKGFVFFTDSRGRKSHELDKNNHAAMNIYWTYKNDQNEHICKQARIEGTVEALPRDDVEQVYNSEPLYAKIRTHLCHQDSVVDWDDMKRRHDELLNQAKTDDAFLTMPDHFVGYRLVPTWMDFYFAKDHFIADRIEFEKNEDGSAWIHKRLAA